MDKKEMNWKCKPCDGSNDKAKDSDVCMICGVTDCNTKLKIVKSRGKHKITYVRDKD